MAGDIHCTIITPEEKVFDAKVDSVIIPAYDGQLGVLKGRAPLVCELGTGVLKADDRQFFVDGGFAQVLNDEVSVLTERAASAESIKRADAEKALADAERMPSPDLAAAEARTKAIQRAKAKLSIAKS